MKELGFLEHVFREGVYDRLSEGGGVKETAETSIGEGRRLRIYQLGAGSSTIMTAVYQSGREKREGMTDCAGRNMSEYMTRGKLKTIVHRRKSSLQTNIQVRDNACP